MPRHLLALATLLVALALPASAAGSITTWQTCSVGPAGDTALCTSGGFPQELTSAAGDLWVTTARGEIIRVSAAAATRGAMTLLPVPGATTGSSGVGLVTGIALGPDGQLWFGQDRVNEVGRVSTAGVFSAFPLTPAPGLTGTRDIVAGPDGAMWLTRASKGTISRVTTAGVETDFVLPGTDLYVALQDLVSGPGDKLWFIRSGQRSIGSITTSGTTAFYKAPDGISYINGIEAGPDGAIWFTAVTTGTPRRGIVGRLSTSGTYSLFDLGPYTPRAIHSDGSQLWLGSDILGPAGHGLLRMTTSGEVTRFEPMLFQPAISSIATGPDSAIWFTDLAGAQVGRIDGKAVPVASAPTPVSIEPGSLALTGEGASVVLEADTEADVDLRAGLTSAAASSSALKVRGAKRVIVPLTRTVGKTSARLGKGQSRRVSVRLSAAARKAIKRGARLQVAVRATETSKRKTVVQAAMRLR